MEETGITIHSDLTRRNKFLRENPQLGEIVAVATSLLWQAIAGRASAAWSSGQII
ncbi:hypothetical protein LMG28688_01159 [Paraburkholderia caffeinitolerans]|uniref:Uncharacterized protein n=1 Tax=Paraburkholderia caffeinitolerans TaxID=1723730 RepID=A0A6J5FJB8_9BURK|nr:MULTISPECIES: hypothetical protein [Paraburkholderia]CAB3780992.1 hypothetical protein LMG28688_01159 [Paraburkholderia caffeinitolerans]